MSKILQKISIIALIFLLGYATGLLSNESSLAAKKIEYKIIEVPSIQ